MLDSIYHMTLRLLWNLISVVKKIAIMYAMLLWTPFYNVTKICKPLVVYWS